MFDTFNEVYEEVIEAGQEDVFYSDFEGSMKTAITVRNKPTNLILKTNFFCN